MTDFMITILLTV